MVQSLYVSSAYESCKQRFHLVQAIQDGSVAKADAYTAMPGAHVPSVLDAIRLITKWYEKNLQQQEFQNMVHLTII